MRLLVHHEPNQALPFNLSHHTGLKVIDTEAFFARDSCDEYLEASRSRRERRIA